MRKLLAVALLLTSWIVGAGAQTGQPLIQAGDVTYLGKFTLPGGIGNPNSLAVLGTTMYVGCYNVGGGGTTGIATVTIPAFDTVAPLVQACQDAPNRAAFHITGSYTDIILGGILPWNGRIIAAGWTYYDGGGGQIKSHWAGTSPATLAGPYQMDVTDVGYFSNGATSWPRETFVGGWMGIVPPEWRFLLGGPALTGQCCVPVIARTSYGPSISVFNPDDVGVVAEPIPSKMLIGYSSEHFTLGNWGITPPATYYGGTDQLGGVAFPAGTSSVLFTGRHGDNFCYGRGTTDLSLIGTITPGSDYPWCYDPFDVDQGNHGPPYRPTMWAYNANDLIAVKNNTKKPWEVLPYAKWQLSPPDLPLDQPYYLRAGYYDPVTSRYYMGSTDRLTVWVFQIGTPSAFTNTETRANSYDNAWTAGWVAAAKTTITQSIPGVTRVTGKVLHIGDSMTITNAYGSWPRNGAAGATATDQAINTWVHATETGNNNGWLLSSTGVTSGSGMSWFDAKIDSLLTDVRTRDAQFAVFMLNTPHLDPTQTTIISQRIDQFLTAGIVPVLSTMPPRNVPGFDAQYTIPHNAAIRALAQARNLPLIDFYQEILLRRPAPSWQGTLIDAGDGVHPTAGVNGFAANSNPYTPGGDPSIHATGDATLNSGYLLRTWLSLAKIKQLKTLVVDALPPPPTTTITVTPGTTFQTMRGWEVVGQADHFNVNFPTFGPIAFDQVVAAGFDRVRLEVRSGSENSSDSFGAWRDAGYPSSGAAYQDWRNNRYYTINDDGSPATDGGASRWHWTEINDTVDKIVTPLRTRLAAQGESLYVNLTYVSFWGAVSAWNPGAQNIHQTPDEYAEFFLKLWQHLQARNGWVPNSIELVLEPDNTTTPTPWTGPMLGQVMVATAARFTAAGLTVPDFVAPSTVNIVTASTWFDQMMAVAGVPALIKELSYHRYSNFSVGALQDIATRAQAAGIASAALECWPGPGGGCPNNFTVLHEDLTVGRASAYEQATIVSANDITGFGAAYVDLANPGAAGSFTYPTRFLTQYYKKVRRGAVRVDASSTNAALAPLAFRNTNGAYTVVVKATAQVASFSVGGLPAGTYSLSYTASSTGSPTNPDLIVTLPNQTITAGQLILTTIPNYGVLTIAGGATPPPPPPPTPPTAVADTYNVAHNTTLTIPAPGVLANDNFQGQTDVTAVLVVGPASGLSLSPNGAISYVPPTGSSGTVTFTYRAVSVIAGAGPTAVSSILVAGPPPPADVNCEETAGAWGPGPEAGGWSTCAASTQFRDRLWTTTQARSGNGLACVFTGSGIVGSTANEHQDRVCVMPPVPPVTVADSYTTPYQTTLTVAAPGVLANDNVNVLTDVTAELISSTLLGGTLTLTPSGAVTFVPALLYTGPASFTYRATSVVGGAGNTVTVSLTVLPDDTPPPFTVDCAETPGPFTPGVLADEFWSACVSNSQYRDRVWTTTRARQGNGAVCRFTGNGAVGATAVEHQVRACVSPPVAADDAFAVVHNTPLTIAAPGILGNDNFMGQTDVTAILQTSALAGGVLSPITTGGFVFTPLTGYQGLASFTYTAVSAIAGASNVATVTLTVAAPNPPPPDVNCAEASGPWGPGSPPEGWSVCDGLPGLSGVQYRDRTWMTTVAKSGNGFACPFTGSGIVGTLANEHQTQACTVATVAPTAVDDTYQVAHNTTLTIPPPGILANDNFQGNLDVTVAVQTTNLIGGGLTAAPDGGLVFTPSAGFAGPASFTYKAASALAGPSNTATVTLNVDASIDPPPPPDIACVETSGAWGPGSPPEGWSTCTELGLAPGSQFRDRIWTTAVAKSGNGLACAFTGGGPVGTTANEHQTQGCNAADPPPPPPPPPPAGVVGVVTARTCILTLAMPNLPPTTATGWGIQFWRRPQGATTWTAHGVRDTTAPFERATAVEAGRWEAHAVWKRSGSADVITATRPFLCSGVVLQ